MIDWIIFLFCFFLVGNVIAFFFYWLSGKVCCWALGVCLLFVGGIALLMKQWNYQVVEDLALDCPIQAKKIAKLSKQAILLGKARTV